MSDIIRELCYANRAAITKLLPRARRLSHVVVDGPEARERQVREFAEAIYIARRAVFAGVIAWQWMDEDTDVDFGDCEPMAEGTYAHRWLHLAAFERGGGQNTIDTLGGIIVPLKSEARTCQDYEDQLAVENYRAIARAYLAQGVAELTDE